MGFLSSFTGSDQARAAKAAGAFQVQQTDRAIQEVQQGEIRSKQSLNPFRRTGEAAFTDVADLVQNPERQREFIEQNPFFDALAGDAQSRLFNNAAARGKVGSGGTAEALQNSLLLLGNDLLAQNVSQRMGIANVGANAANQQAVISANSGATIADLFTQRGNAGAAGLVGAANARGAGASNVVGTGLAIGKLALSDARYKSDATQIGALSNGLPVYRFRYVSEDRYQIGVMAQDVQRMIPDAVHEVDGVLYVDYEAIH